MSDSAIPLAIYAISLLCLVFFDAINEFKVKR